MEGRGVSSSGRISAELELVWAKSKTPQMVQAKEKKAAPPAQTPMSKPPSLIAPQSPAVQSKQPASDDTSDEEKDPEQAEQDADAATPKTPQNPFAKPDIDSLIKKQFDDDMWRLMKGALPCLETSSACLQQLQEKAVTQSPLLKEIDQRVQEANQKIEDAKERNQKSIKLSIFSPALQYMLESQTLNNGGSKKQNTGGLIDNVAALFTGKIGLLNGLLKVIGIPLFEGSQGGGDSVQNRAIQISDIQIRIAELQRERAKLADEVRDKVAKALIDFDEARVSFQTAQVLATRSMQQFQIYEVRYVRGDNDTESYLARLNSLDHTKAQTYETWAKMRRSLFQIKLLVLNVQEAEN
jgi:hypothetical protein